MLNLSPHSEQDEGERHVEKIRNEIEHDLAFLRSHTLQPKWFKVFKIFLVLGVFTGYYFLFGFPKTALFVATFLMLMLVVHFIYRAKTKKYTTSWLDFVVHEEGQETRPKRIGKFYYPVIVVNAIIALIISQIFG
jgi:Ca2+-dependent lipid-binding protein, contains C2 domain